MGKQLPQPQPGPQHGAIAWERVPEMENRVGVQVVRGSGKWVRGEGGAIRVEMIVELAPLSEPSPGEYRCGGYSYPPLKLSAVADTADGTLVGYDMKNIPSWDAFPPIKVVGNFLLAVDAVPARIRVYPEVN